MPNPQSNILTWAQTAALNPNTTICLGGAQLAPSLAWLGSLRCHDYRDSEAPLDALLVESPAPRAA